MGCHMSLHPIYFLKVCIVLVTNILYRTPWQLSVLNPHPSFMAQCNMRINIWCPSQGHILHIEVMFNFYSCHFLWSDDSYWQNVYRRSANIIIYNNWHHKHISHYNYNASCQWHKMLNIHLWSIFKQCSE